MIIECAQCHARYQYDEDRFERKRSKKIRCARCKQVFEIFNPAFQEPETPKVKSTEDTVVRRRPQREDEPDEEGPAADPEKPASDEEEEEEHGDGLDAPLRLPEDLRLSLAITAGPDAAKVYRVEKARTVVGRSSADFRLNDPESSREHAALEVHENSYFLRDLDSRNGTFIGAEKLGPEPVEIFNHTEFRIGGTTLMLIVTEIE